MVQARTAGRPGRTVAPSQPGTRLADTDRLREHVAELLLQAAEFISPARVEETARGWLSRAEPVDDDPGREMLLVADALGMATDLALFTPSVSGATAFDRLSRRRGGMGAGEAALDALRRAQLRLLRAEASSSEGAARLRDLVTDERLSVLDESIGPEAVGVALVVRLAPLGDGRHVLASGAVPLDGAGLAVAQGFVGSRRTRAAAALLRRGGLPPRAAPRHAGDPRAEPAAEGRPGRAGRTGPPGAPLGGAGRRARP